MATIRRFISEACAWPRWKHLRGHICRFRLKLTWKLGLDLNLDFGPAQILMLRGLEQEGSIRNCLTSVFRVLVKFTEMYQKMAVRTFSIILAKNACSVLICGPTIQTCYLFPSVWIAGLWVQFSCFMDMAQTCVEWAARFSQSFLYDHCVHSCSFFAFHQNME